MMRHKNIVNHTTFSTLYIFTPTYDFSILYTNLPLQTIFDSLLKLIIKMFIIMVHILLISIILNKSTSGLTQTYQVMPITV